MKRTHLSYIGIGAIFTLAGGLWYFDRFPRQFFPPATEGTSLAADSQVKVSVATPPPLIPDAQLQAIVDQEVAKLKSAGFDPTQQGLWVESNQHTIASFQGHTPLPVASITKLATSLTALQTWPTDYRFYTRILSQGSIDQGILKGDLIVQGGGDPFYVWESAILLGNRLNQMGIKQVTGRLIIRGLFTMNFERDPALAGNLFRRALNADNWSEEAALQYQKNMPAGTPKPAVTIAGDTVVDTGQTDLPKTGLVTLVEQPSLPLVQLLKQMNNYSNNIMAQQFADLLGGPKAMKDTVTRIAEVPPNEVFFSNGSGLGPENQISPAGVCQIIQAIGKTLHPHGLGVSDVLPIANHDPGTLAPRHFPLGMTAKTGTLWDVSTLAGLINQGNQPPSTLSAAPGKAVCFAILNRGENLDYFYSVQEEFVGKLKSYLSPSSPAPIASPTTASTSPPQ